MTTILGPFKATQALCRHCGKLFAITCLCGGVALAPLKGVDLPSANAFGQLVNVAATTSTTSTSFGAHLPVFTVADNVTDRSTIFWSSSRRPIMAIVPIARPAQLFSLQVRQRSEADGE